jgi:hypothetical protein
MARWPPALPMSPNAFHELAGVARVAQVAHAHDQLAADDAGDDRPLDVFDCSRKSAV